MDKNIVISIKTILLTVLIGAGLFILVKLGYIIGIIFLSLLVAISLESTVQFFSRQTFLNASVPRPLAVLLTYLLVFLALTIGLTLGFDPLITQSGKLLSSLSKHASVISLGQNIDISLSELLASFQETSGGVINATKSIFTNVTAIFSILVLSVYLSIDWENIKTRFVEVFPEKEKQRVKETVIEIEDSIGRWLKGQAVLMLSIGVLSYIVLVAIGVDYPLALGIMSGILEIIPVLGPIFSAIVAGAVALMISPIKALMVIFAFTIIQQLEGNILVPKVMQKVSGFSPIVILLALLIGANLFGIVGAVVAIPSLMIGSIIIQKFVLGR